MKLLLLACILALTMSAQTATFHGVSISGTDAPIIANSPDNQPLLGLVYQRLDTHGVNSINHDVDYSRILTGNLLQPGQNNAPPPGAYSTAGNLKVRVLRLDSAGNKTMVVEGDTLGYKILAVVFADGTFYSQATAADVQAFNQDGSPVADTAVQDKLYRRLAADISAIRDMGRDLQGHAVEDRTLALRRLSLPSIARGVSIDPLTEGHRKQMALMLSQLADEDSRTAAIGRLAALPEVTKGE